MKKLKIGKLNKDNIANWLCTILGTALPFVVCSLRYDFLYYANDDVMIQDILSGRFSGQASSRTVYFNEPLSFLLSGFYSFHNRIPWFGIFQLFCYGLCLFLLLWKLSNRVSKVWQKISLTLLTEILFGALLSSQFVMPTYTVTAAVVGASSIFLMFAEKKEKTCWWSMVLALLCYEIRSNVFYLMLPFALGAMVFLDYPAEIVNKIRLQKKGKNSFRDNTVKDSSEMENSTAGNLENKEAEHSGKSFLGLAVFLGAFLFLYLINVAAYLGSDWKEYLGYNDLRTQVYDYDYIDGTEAAMDYYHAEGLSEETIRDYQDYNILLADDQTRTPLQIFHDYHEEYKVTGLQAWKDAAYVYVQRLLNGTDDSPYNALAICLYVLLFLCLGLSKEKNGKRLRDQFLLVLLFAGRSVIWIYLIWKGRYPERITVSLYLFELFLLLGVLLTRWEKKVSWQIAAVMLYGVGIWGMLYGGSLLNTAYRTQCSVNQGYDMVYSYMREHPENFYLLDVKAFATNTEYAIKDYDASYHNYMLLGGWMVGHPLLEEKLEREQIGNVRVALYTKENVFFISNDPDYFAEDSVEILQEFTVGEQTFYVLKPQEFSCRI